VKQQDSVIATQLIKLDSSGLHNQTRLRWHEDVGVIDREEDHGRRCSSSSRLLWVLGLVSI